MKVRNFGRTNRRAVRARIELGRDVFVNFAGRWEWYRIDRKGLERSMGYVINARYVAVLDQAFRVRPEPALECDVIPTRIGCTSESADETRPGVARTEGERRLEAWKRSRVLLTEKRLTSP